MAPVKSNNVLPRFSPDDAVNGLTTYTELSGDLSIADNAFRIARTDRTHAVWGELCARNIRPFHLSVFSNLISCVFRSVAEKQVIRVHACGVVAAMEDMNPVRNQSNVKCPRQTMSKKRASVISNKSVSCWIGRTLPFPTTARNLVDVATETLFRCAMACVSAWSGAKQSTAIENNRSSCKKRFTTLRTCLGNQARSLFGRSRCSTSRTPWDSCFHDCLEYRRFTDADFVCNLRRGLRFVLGSQPFVIVKGDCRRLAAHRNSSFRCHEAGLLTQMWPHFDTGIIP